SLQSSETHSPHPGIRLPRAAGSLAVDCVPERAEVVSRGDAHQLIHGPVTHDVRVSRDAFGYGVSLGDLMQPFRAHLGHLESDARRPPGHVERRAPSKRALTPLKERLPEP